MSQTTSTDPATVAFQSFVRSNKRRDWINFIVVGLLSFTMWRIDGRAQDGAAARQRETRADTAEALADCRENAYEFAEAQLFLGAINQAPPEERAELNRKFEAAANRLIADPTDDERRRCEILSNEAHE